jgi:hypothetical protein
MAVLIHAETKFLFVDKILEVNKMKIPIKSLVDVLIMKCHMDSNPHFLLGSELGVGGNLNTKKKIVVSSSAKDT